MIALKKTAITLMGLLFLVPSIAQEKGDIGLIISSSRYNKSALEYRKPFGEKYHFRIAATYGERGSYYWGTNNQIISVSDSIVLERNLYKNSYQTGLRFGAERQFGNSMFSIATDLSIDYRQSTSVYRTNAKYLQGDGTWGSNSTSPTIYTPFDNPTNSRITRHYLSPGARISLNMNIPLGKAFLLNLSASGTFGLPIYMGATQVQDAEGNFIGTPPAIFNFDTHLGIGLRYIFGSRNKERG
ncbi:MAG: hypothetical protein ACI8ZM_001173 [Crocinitomix sp.]|jgi:hypothetical protein